MAIASPNEKEGSMKEHLQADPNPHQASIDSDAFQRRDRWKRCIACGKEVEAVDDFLRCRACAQDHPWEQREDDPCSYITGQVADAKSIQWVLQNAPDPHKEERWTPSEAAEIESCMREVMQPHDTHYWMCFIRQSHQSKIRVFTALDSRWDHAASIDAHSARRLAEKIREYGKTGRIPPRPNPLY